MRRLTHTDMRRRITAGKRLTRVSEPGLKWGSLAGSCVFHCGEVWAGSAANTTGDRMRRAIGVHMLPVIARFRDRPGGYIYRRYQRTGDPTLDESYFPILWSRSGQRTTWIENYCSSGVAPSGLRSNY
jgi:hypothetical protein